MSECLIIAFSSVACRKVAVCAISKLMLITARTKELRVVWPSRVALWRTK